MFRGRIVNERQHNIAGRRRRVSARGFTLVELLIGMIMLVMIMVAAALAMQGAANASEYGLDKARSLQQASLTLRRISSDIRRAQSIQLPQAGCLDLVMPDNQWRRYRWNPAAGGNPLTFWSDGNPLGNTLIPDVTEFTIQTVNGWSEAQQAVVPMCVRITIEARQGTASTRLDTMILPRRNIL
jgi:prepilin-type N-terminal cleavage/methylation domain-containing protein